MRSACGNAPRKVRQEGVIGTIARRVAVVSLVFLAIVVGCGKAHKKADSDEGLAKKKPPEESKRLYTKAGNAMVRDPEGTRPIRYVINWEESQLDYTLDQGASGGALKKVSGELYRSRGLFEAAERGAQTPMARR